MNYLSTQSDDVGCVNYDDDTVDEAHVVACETW